MTSFIADTLEPDRTALLLIEFQREWLDPTTGKLGHLMEDQNQLRSSAMQSKRLLDMARLSGIHIVHVPCLYQVGYPEIAGGLEQGLFYAIPRAKTWIGEGGSFANGFEPKDGEFIVGGRVGASAFAHSNLDIFLRANKIKYLLLTGYALHVCVESTLRQGHDLGYSVMVVEDACAAFNMEQQNYVLRHVIHHFGTAITVDQAQKLLKR